jgi:nucleoside-diphosphate-sugar epimerase
MSEHVLITGADGYVGRLLAGRYLATTDARLTLFVRAADQAAAAEKRARMQPFISMDMGTGADARGGDPAASRVQWVYGDITSPAAFERVDRSSITTIVHAAAVTRFNVEQPLAQAVNVDGAAHVLDLAARCPALASLGMLSTVYASGLRPGLIEEVPLEGGHGFANYYEWSKFEAEKLALARQADLPVKIIRLSTVIADDASGRVSQHNAFHNTLKLYFHGLLSLLPGDQATPVYIVTGRFVADAVFALLAPAVEPGIYHVAHEVQDSPTLGDLISRVFDTFEQNDGFRRRRVLRPLYASQKSFDDLAEGVESFGGEVVKQALRSMTPFARQLYVRKEFSNRSVREILGDQYAPEPVDPLIERVSKNLVSTRWGRQQAAG